MQSPIQWIPVDCGDGPYLQNHAGAILGNRLYVHGGLRSDRTVSKSASNGFYAINLSPHPGQWMDLTTHDSPNLSQHTCVTFADRYLIFIGGWTGQNRIPGVHTFDTTSQKWLPAAVAEPLLKGFPSGAGLSAHTATAIQTSRPQTKMCALIIGREGSLRTQRKAGNIYLLHGDFSCTESPNPNVMFHYYEADPGLTTSSRSYHTSTAAGPFTLVNIGGRKDRPVELLHWTPAKKSTPDWPGELLYPGPRCDVVSELINSVRTKSIPFSPMPQAQSCWRGHAAVPGDGGVFISSGEGFNALVRDPLDSAYVFIRHDGLAQHRLHNIGKLRHPRAYAVCDVHVQDGIAWLHGGIGPAGKTQNTLLKLERDSTARES